MYWKENSWRFPFFVKSIIAKMTFGLFIVGEEKQTQFLWLIEVKAKLVFADFDENSSKELNRKQHLE